MTWVSAALRSTLCLSRRRGVFVCRAFGGFRQSPSAIVRLNCQTALPSCGFLRCELLAHAVIPGNDCADWQAYEAVTPQRLVQFNVSRNRPPECEARRKPASFAGGWSGTWWLGRTRLEWVSDEKAPHTPGLQGNRSQWIRALTVSSRGHIQTRGVLASSGKLWRSLQPTGWRPRATGVAGHRSRRRTPSSGDRFRL